MKWRVTIRSAAIADLRDAREWYERRRHGLGDEFHVAIADAFIRLEEAPESFSVYYRGFRRLLTERFTYKVFFRIQDKSVIVLRVLHAARDHTRELK